LCCPAADHLKFQLPYGYAVSTLAWSAVAFQEDYKAAVTPAGTLWDISMRNLLFATDYMIRCHIAASDTPTENVYVAQVRAHMFCLPHLRVTARAKHAKPGKILPGTGT
jgi:hypothetical protein